ncbi:TBC1 domain family member 16-like [Mya arenaria]|uniref:TBC1 domain family member 16-like n=1 Tax=Mya arenaria TaxID=6604 RepID=UPI0022E4AD0E|nr:TBC1 domain family member 16-like [Mya arenaria]XP_052760921.1 TBC1 domain family member 16-like [Mya arenaria]
MAFSTLFKKASNLLGFSSPTNLKPPPLDGEIIYCKNNVCVHPPTSLTADWEEHHQGYLTLRSTKDKVSGPTLILTWIPNSTLRKNTKSIENSPNRSHGTTPKSSPRRTPRQEYSKSDNCLSSPTTSMTDLSPLDSCVSVGSDMGGKTEGAQKCYTGRKYSNDSVTSDPSHVCLECNSCSATSDQENQRKISDASTTSGRLDSGIHFGGDEGVQNNERCVCNVSKGNKIGQNVNDLYAERVSQINSELNHLTKLALADDANHEKSENQRHVSRARTISKQSTSSNKSVSIEMDGDNICITTEDLVDEVLEDNNCDTGGNCESNHCSHSENEMNNKNNNPELRQSMCNGDDTNMPKSDSISPHSSSVPPHPQSLKLSAINTTAVPNYLTTPDISVTRERNPSGSSTTTSGPDSEPPSPYSSSPEQGSGPWEPDIHLETPSSPESLSCNLQFPENSVGGKSKGSEKKTAKEQVCGVFSVDLGQMRSLRVFYSDADYKAGQIVIASRESQYKILHFHHGGLDKLAEIFQDWSLFATNQEKNDGEYNYKQFMIVKPSLTEDQCHPEEGVYSRVNEDVWKTHMMDDGVIEDDYLIRKAIFFGGLEPILRHEVWPFLLHYFPFDTTFEEREQIRNDKFIEYQNIRKKRESLSPEEQEVFWRNVQCTVEKDVVRTDRSHPYFRGENNPNIDVLKNILLNYAVENPHFGYTQGMSDLLAPVLAEIQKEVDAYWCFTGLMQKTIFVSSPKDCDMDRQLLYLRELLHLMQPRFYEHLQHLGQDAMELLFAHRWILLCFKREFPEKGALRIWESCWAHYQTDYFHLFICVAIVAIYGEDIVEQCLPADEILLHFSSLACHMNGDLVLRKARGLLNEYRRRPMIPCTLHGLCSQCGQGMWDSGHVPTVKCVGSHLHGECPYLASPHSSPGD